MFVVAPKVKKFRKAFADRLKEVGVRSCSARMASARRVSVSGAEPSALLLATMVTSGQARAVAADARQRGAGFGVFVDEAVEGRVA